MKNGDVSFKIAIRHDTIFAKFDEIYMFLDSFILEEYVSSKVSFRFVHKSVRIQSLKLHKNGAVSLKIATRHKTIFAKFDEIHMFLDSFIRKSVWIMSRKWHVKWRCVLQNSNKTQYHLLFHSGSFKNLSK